MSGERLPVAEPADVRRAAGELVRADRVLAPTGAKASARSAHGPLPDDAPEHPRPVTRDAEQGAHEEVAG
ncbi:hypothetical protein [Streptomyces albogriseolus]|uniref:hypothetical protein n=1 Tax=Streptomyces albogriseolus TaxID=1887 RepID=UPI003D71CA2F